MRPYVLLTTCVSAPAEKIHEMRDSARPVTLATVRRHCDLREWEHSMGYRRGDLTLKDDWAVSFFKSRYDGRPCYYIVHSAIEHVFVEGKA